MNKPEVLAYLDKPEAFQEHDPGKIASILLDFPNQLRQAQADFDKIKLTEKLAESKQVVFCGMGGSAIGAQVAADLPAKLKRKPVYVVNDYDLPAWVDKDTAVVVMSYSGETAEALSCFDQAINKGSTVVVVASGGALAKKAQAAEVALYKFDYQAPPRDALGYLLVPAILILVHTQVLGRAEADIELAIKLTEELRDLYEPKIITSQNIAKQLAYSLFDHIPVVVGSSLTKSVARRWKNQINEHSKTASWFDELPETNHNTVEGFGLPTRFKDDAAVILLESQFDNPAVIKRQELWHQHLTQQGVQVTSIEAKGDDIWSNKLSLIYLGDWVSYYLAILNRLDPMSIPVINELKSKLSSN